MLFNFTLVPVERILPWGEPGKQYLHWFGLTDGQYWIEVGKDTLFEYSEYVRSRPGATRYCNYQVVRLYEDLMEMVPHVLEVVPTWFVPFISGDSARAWQAALWRRVDELDDEDSWNMVYAATSWIGSRTLDNTHLSPSSNIQMWSDASTVHIEWDNRDRLFAGKPAWSADRGSFELGRDAFIWEVRSFHMRLMDQMAQRIKEVLAGALPPEVQIDLPGLELEREHVLRYRTIDEALGGPTPPTDWESVSEAIEKVERDLSIRPAATGFGQ